MKLHNNTITLYYIMKLILRNYRQGFYFKEAKWQTLEKKIKRQTLESANHPDAQMWTGNKCAELDPFIGYPSRVKG